MTENQDIKLRFYSQRAITIATYLGGPLAAGYLVRQNFINLGKKDYGKYALIIGIVLTLLIIAAVMAIPLARARMQRVRTPVRAHLIFWRVRAKK